MQANYQAYLGRMGNSAEVTYWVVQFRVNHQTTEDLAAGFVGSYEHFNRGNKGQGNKDAWLAAAYLDVVHRAIMAEEKPYRSTLLP